VARPDAAGYRRSAVRIDHVIYGTADLAAAAARIEAQLGLTAVAGGRHDRVGIHNRIVPLGDGSFLELLAVADPEEAARSALPVRVVDGPPRVRAIEVAGRALCPR
jgi:glyoxalase-like protein